MTPIIRAEILKLTSVRRTWIAGAIALLLTLLFLIVGLIFFGRAVGDEVPPTDITDRIALVASGVTFAALVVGVAGIQALASEFSTNSIIPSAVAVPRRSTLLNSKIAAVAIAAFVFAAALTILSLVISMIGLEIKDYPLRFGDHDMARIAIGMVLVPVLYALYGLALALLVGNSTTAIAILLVQATLGESALGSFLPDDVAKFLPFRATGTIVSTDPPINPYEGLAVMSGWIFLLFVIGAALFERRDLA